MTFDEWKKQNPFAWHPGLKHSEADHQVYLQTLLVSLGPLRKYEYDELPQAIASIEVEMPTGFQGPYDPRAYQTYNHAYERIRIEQLSDNLDRVVEGFDPGIAATVLGRKVAQLKRAAAESKVRHLRVAQG